MVTFSLVLKYKHFLLLYNCKSKSFMCIQFHDSNYKLMVNDQRVCKQPGQLKKIFLKLKIGPRYNLHIEVVSDIQNKSDATFYNIYNICTYVIICRKG